MAKKSDRKYGGFEEALSRHKDLAKKVMGQDHLEFAILYAFAESSLPEREQLHVEAHVAACEVCQGKLLQVQKSIQEAQNYQPEETNLAVPEEVIGAIPKPVNPRGGFVMLHFNEERMLTRVLGVVKSMGGMLENLADLTIEALAPDTKFLAEVRGESIPVTDYKVHYQKLDIYFSVLPEQHILEVFIEIKGRAPAELESMEFQLMDEAAKVYRPEGRANLKNSLKLTFGKLELEGKSYEFQIPSEPVTD